MKLLAYRIIVMNSRFTPYFLEQKLGEYHSINSAKDRIRMHYELTQNKKILTSIEVELVQG